MLHKFCQLIVIISKKNVFCIYQLLQLLTRFQSPWLGVLWINSDKFLHRRNYWSAKDLLCEPSEKPRKRLFNVGDIPIYHAIPQFDMAYSLLSKWMFIQQLGVQIPIIYHSFVSPRHDLFTRWVFLRFIQRYHKYILIIYQDSELFRALYMYIHTYVYLYIYIYICMYFTYPL